MPITVDQACTGLSASWLVIELSLIVLGAWLALFYVASSSMQVLGSNFTDEQLDIYRDIMLMPYVMFMAGVAAGWLYTECSATEQKEKARTAV